MNYNLENKKVYIAGKITGFDGYKEKFAEAEEQLKVLGAIPMNPAILPPGFTQEEYLKICFSMIDVCDCVFLLDNWKDSKGANKEFLYAYNKGKTILDKDNLFPKTRLEQIQEYAEVSYE
ncbi:MAG: DUF4406 domain-containing protein [Aminipila sp.]